MISKATNDLKSFDFTNGEVILIDKDSDISSFGIIRRLRGITGIKKIGHAGTLDPKATGLMILCSGKKTKTISSYQDMKKVYSGIITLGKITASMDSEMEATEEKNTSDVTLENIEEVRKTFLGIIQQVPPMYSAIKHKGRSLYKYARKGIEIKRFPREIEVYDFEIIKYDEPDIYFNITCSKGTYIRVIADDFGKKLGCGAFLGKLRREAIGEYNVDTAYTINEFEKEFNSIAVNG